MILSYLSQRFSYCTEGCVPILETLSGLTYNQDFFCGYNPERINPGDKVNTLIKKKNYSGSTPAVAEEIDALYKSIVTAYFSSFKHKVAEAAKVMRIPERFEYRSNQ